MLVIIDMQPHFDGMKVALPFVVQEVKRAKKRKEWIMLVEYKHLGKTTKHITDLLKHYKKTVTVLKVHDDGSAAIFDRLYGYHWVYKPRKLRRIRHLRVAGINTGACVVKTVEQLARFCKVTVLSKACADGPDPIEDNASHRNSIKEMSKWRNVKIG